MFTGLLPIGSVVLLKNSTKKLMITGFAQVAADDPDKIYDYVGCVYPEGFLGPDQTFLFNSDQIASIFFVGYQDQEQMAFKVRIDQALADIRGKEKTQDENQNHE